MTTTVSKKMALERGRAIKRQTTDLDDVKSFSAEDISQPCECGRNTGADEYHATWCPLKTAPALVKDFKGLNKTVRVPFPKPKHMPNVQTTIPGSAPDNGKLKEEINEAVKVKAHDHEFVQHSNPSWSTHVMCKFPGCGFAISKNSIRHIVNSPFHGTFTKKQKEDLKPLVNEAYVAPNVGNSNYAQNLPAPQGVLTNKGKRPVDKRLVIPKKEAYADSNRDAGYVAHEEVISSYEQVQEIIDKFITEELKVGEKEDVDGNNEAKKFRGTNAKGPGTGKVRTVARKLLGKRGRTATGQKAHEIDVEPVIGAQDKNWNKTTPSGDKKQG